MIAPGHLSGKHGTPRPGRRALTSSSVPGASASACTDVLILSDGTVLAHNLTPAMAGVLKELNPGDEAMKKRFALKARTRRSRTASR